MPIDFVAVAARFEAAFAAQLKNVTVAQKLLDPVLAKRSAAGRAVELATRQFPIVLFQNGAVTLRLAPSQRGVLTLAKPPTSIGHGLAAGGLAFLDGLANATRPLRADSQERAIPRFLTSADRALAVVEASVRKFAVPTPGMFDPDPRTASDLFGLAALAFRALAEASAKGGRIQRLGTQVRTAMDVFQAPATGDRPPTADEVPRTPDERLDAMASALLGAIGIVGSLPGLLHTLFEGTRIRLHQVVLDEFGAIERIVLDLRRTAFQAVFAGLSGLAARGVDLVRGAMDVVGRNILFSLRFWGVLGGFLAVGVRDFVVRFGRYLRDFLRFTGVLPSLLDAVTRFDLTELLRSKLGRVTGAIPSFGLGDLLDASGHNVNTALELKLNLALDAAEAALDRLTLGIPFLLISDTYRFLYRELHRARRLVRELFDSHGSGSALPVLRETAPLRFHSDMPNVGDTLFRDHAAGLHAVVDRLGMALRRGASGALSRTERGFGRLADEFAADAGRVGVARGLDRIGARSDALADLVFGPEVTAQREAVRTRVTDAVARAFESWLADGGFLVVGGVIDGYVRELASYWRAQLTEGTELTAPITPTSPHLLRKRAVLGRVVVPRLTLRAAPGRELDEELANAVAAQFAAAVRDAHRTGRERLRAIAALPAGTGR